MNSVVAMDNCSCYGDCFEVKLLVNKYNKNGCYVNNCHNSWQYL